MYMCTCTFGTCADVHVPMCMCKCTCSSVHAQMGMGKCACASVHVQTYMRKCTCANVHVQMYMCEYTFANVHVQMCICTCTSSTSWRSSSQSAISPSFYVLHTFSCFILLPQSVTSWDVAIQLDLWTISKQVINRYFINIWAMNDLRPAFYIILQVLLRFLMSNIIY